MLIKSSKSLCGDYLSISKLAHESAEPIYITQYGEGDLVLMEMEAFESREKTLRMRIELELAGRSCEPPERIPRTAAGKGDGPGARAEVPSEEELGAILRAMYDGAPKGDQVAHISLFGIRYAELLENERLSKREILRHANLAESYQTELSKGVRLARYVTVRGEQI